MDGPAGLRLPWPPFSPHPVPSALAFPPAPDPTQPPSPSNIPLVFHAPFVHSTTFSSCPDPLPPRHPPLRPCPRRPPFCFWSLFPDDLPPRTAAPFLLAPPRFHRATLPFTPALGALSSVPGPFYLTTWPPAFSPPPPRLSYSRGGAAPASSRSRPPHHHHGPPVDPAVSLLPGGVSTGGGSAVAPWGWGSGLCVFYRAQ